MFKKRYDVKNLVMEADYLVEKVHSENRDGKRNIIFKKFDKYIKRALNLINSDLKIVRKLKKEKAIKIKIHKKL